jgi:SAM-dependent methyltransferase
MLHSSETLHTRSTLERDVIHAEVAGGAPAKNDVAYAEGGAGTAALDTLEEADAYNRWIVDFIRPRLGAVNLELGAGHGTLCSIVGETHHVLPFEVSGNNQRIIRERFVGHPRVSACRGDILDYREWGSVSCVYSANVLEHIEDDLAIVRHCARLLQPGGHFVAFVPAGKWLYSAFDRKIGHHRRYGRSDRERLAQVGLAVREYRYVNALGALGWFINMRLLQSQSVSAGNVALVQRLLPTINKMDALRLPLGQSLVIALERVAT